MKEVDLTKYAKFVNHCYRDKAHAHAESWTESFHIEGYKSANYTTGIRQLLLSDEDYFLFVIKWS